MLVDNVIVHRHCPINETPSCWAAEEQKKHGLPTDRLEGPRLEGQTVSWLPNSHAAGLEKGGGVKRGVATVCLSGSSGAGQRLVDGGIGIRCAGGFCSRLYQLT
jgi:hypothetical protein